MWIKKQAAFKSWGRLLTRRTQAERLQLFMNSRQSKQLFSFEKGPYKLDRPSSACGRDQKLVSPLGLSGLTCACYHGAFGHE